MKTMKLEFVVFNISQENAVFLWKIITRFLEYIGFDITGNVTELTEIDPEKDELDFQGFTD